MKKQISAIILVLVCLAFLAALVLPFTAAGTSSATIKGHNVAVSPDVAGGGDLKKDEKIHILYYVDFQNVSAGAEIGVLVWKNRQSSYIYGKQDAKLSPVGTYGTYVKFSYDEISARMMTQDIYAVPYIKSGDNIVYGKLDKYSVLQYAYNKKGSYYTSNDISGTLGDLLTKLLDKGAAAQEYYGYKTNRLANGTYYQLSVVNGALEDTTDHGLYQSGDKVSLTANIDGFDHWENSAKANVSSSPKYTATVEKVETYTATNEPDTHEHTWDDGEVTLAATCTAEGEMTYTCTVCLTKRTEVISMIEHTIGVSEIVIADDGQSAVERFECSVCKQKYYTEESYSYTGIIIKNAEIYTFEKSVRVANNLPDGFFEYAGETYYILNNTVITNYYIINNVVYNFGDDGANKKEVINNVFITINNKEYYVVNNTIVKNYYIINNTMYYFGDDGVKQDITINNQFITIKNNVYYVVNNLVITGYYIINNTVYYFGDDGIKQDIDINNIVITINSKQYYVVNNNIVKNVYIINNDIVYYFGEDGVKQDININNRFITINSKQYYVVNNTIVKDYYIINNVVYYFGDDGVKQDIEINNTFITIDSKEYYVVNNTIVKNYYIINNVAYYFGDDGVKQNITINNTFITVENKEYYVVNNVIVKDYYIINNIVYYFGEDGVKQDVEVNNTFITINSKQYYVINNTIVKNYYVVNNTMYYFGDDGVMQDIEINNVFITVDSKEYYVVNNTIVKNYYVVDNTMYYFGEDGVKQNKTINNTFITIEDKQYYVVNNTIVKNYYVVNNVMYYFGDDGVKQDVEINNTFITIDSKEYYVVNNTIVKNYYIVNNVVYYFGEDGVKQNIDINNIFITVENKEYYVVNNTFVTNYYVVNNTMYYFGEDGVKQDVEINNTFITVDSKQYYVVNNTIVKNYYVVNNTMYYFGDDGVKQDVEINNTFITIDSKEYYVVNNTIVKDYYIINNVAYYFGEDGVKQDVTVNNLFVTVEDKEYYVVNNNIVTNYYVVDNVMYYFGDDGVKQEVEINNTFITIDSKEYYVVNNTIVKNYYIVNNVVYYFGEDGVKQDVTVNNLFVTVENKEYYVVNNNIVTNYYVVDNTMYYFGTDGVKQDVEINNTFITIESKQYYVINNTIVKNYYVVNNVMYYFGDDGVNQGAVHEFTDWIAEVSATCTTNGAVAHYDCKTCNKHFDADYNEIKNIVIPMTGHTPGDWVIDVEPTCTIAGSKYRACSVCQAILQTSYVSELGHDYMLTDTLLGDCENPGKLTYVCERCGYVHEVYTYSEHNYELAEQQEPSCTEAGYKLYRCSVCGAEYTETIPAGQHVFTSELVRKATKEETGIIRYTCGICEYSYDIETPKLGDGANVLLVQDRNAWNSPADVDILVALTNSNQIASWEVTTSSELASKEFYEYSVIFIANDQYSSTYSNLGSVNDRLIEYVNAGGVLVYGASDNGWTNGNISYSLPGGVVKANYYSSHNYISDASHPIVTAGMTDGKGLTDEILYHNYCSHSYFTNLPDGANVIIRDANGNPTLVEYELGYGTVILSGLTWEHAYIYHTYFDSYSYATRVYDDVLVYAASLVVKCDHIWDDGVVVEPTCTERGYTVHTCSECGATSRDQFTDPLGHKFGEWIIDEEATCIKEGKKHRVCSVCEAIENDVIPFADHVEVIDEAVPATCIATGLTEGKHCSVCGKILVAQEVVPMTDHVYGDDDICDICGASRGSVGLKYTSNGDGTCYVSGIGTCTDTDIIIPSVSPDGDTVTSIGIYAFEYCRSLTSIEIPASVTSIGDHAFSGCKKLTSITFAENSQLTSIGDYAFYNCSSLTSIEIPASVTSIREWAFYGCSSLTIITFAENSQLTSIGRAAFYGCESLTSIEIPASVTSIGSAAFYGCYSLTSITFAENSQLTSIGSAAFEYCSSLTSIEIPASVTSIGSAAFEYCRSLTSIEIPASVTSIEIEAFYYCSSLTNIEIPASVTSIGNRAFDGCSSLTSIEIPASVTRIGSFAFSGCSSFTSITVAEGNTVYHSAGNCLIKTASKTLIAGCKNSVIPTDGSVTSIGSYAFAWCESLMSIEIPASVTSIGEDAFSGCSSLTSIEIPASVTSIGDNAFSGCKSLTSIEIPASVTSIGSGAFYYCNSLTDVYYGGSLADWQNIEIGEDNDPLLNATLHTVEGYEYSEGLKFTSNGDGTCYVSGIGTCTDRDIVVPEKSPAGDTVTAIGNGYVSGKYTGFYNCSNITSVVIPEGVTSIGENAFGYCSALTSIEIPEGVTSIGYGAFAYCSSLTSIEIPEGVTSIGHGAFSGCSALTSIEIPESVTSIGYEAFYGCSALTSIEIPEGVTSIGTWAFGDCSALTDVYYGGSFADWQKITIDYGNDPLLNAVLHTVEGYEYSEGLAFTSNGDGTCYVSGIGTCTDTDIIIPSKSPAGDTVTAIGNGEWINNRYTGFYNCEDITSVAIPEGVTSIGNYAFEYCYSLTSITFAENSQLTSIGERAFEDCRALTSIEIPASVTSIGDGAFKDCYSLTSIEIPEGVTSIGEWAFYYCSSLTSIEIPEGVTSIGYGAFAWCSALTSIEIPEGVTSIGNYAFYDCRSLTSIEIPEGVTSIGEYAFAWCYSLTSIEIPEGVTSIGNYAFCDCRSLTSIEIPEGVTSIGEYAFAWCYSLTIIEIPEGVTSIGNYAFAYCSSLTDVYYGGSLADWQKITIGSDNDPLLNAVLHTVEQSNDSRIIVENKSANAGDTITVAVSIENNPGFQTLAMNIEYDESVMTLTKVANGSDFSDYTFTKPKNMSSGCKAAWYVTDLPEEIVDGDILILTFTIKDTAASGTYNVTVSDTKDGSNEFEFATATGNITVVGATEPEYSVGLVFTSNGDGTCYVSGIGDCTDTDIIIPSVSPAGDIVTSIGERAFYWCDSLTSIEIPASVTSIGARAFEDCSSLTSIEIPASVTSIGSSAFSYCSSLTSITVAEGNTVYHSAGNCLIKTASKMLIAGCKNSVIPTDGSVTSIGWYAFYGCSSLTSIEIPASVTYIGGALFGGCDALVSIVVNEGNTVYHSAGNCIIETESRTLVGGCGNSVIPTDGSVTIIGWSAFDGCTSLTSIEIPACVTSIGSAAFQSCRFLEYVIFEENSQLENISDWVFSLCGFTSIEIPDGVTSIGEWAIAQCSNLTSVSIPASVTSIGEQAFFNSDSLTDVYYGGSLADWQKITIESDNNDLLNATIHFVDDEPGEPIGEVIYTIEGDYIYFGSYPQSEVTDAALKATLNAKAGTLPDFEDAGDWTSYGYYDYGKSADYMWYRDVEFDGQMYRGVYLRKYRSFASRYEAWIDGNESYQDENGIELGVVYWFRFEPLKWRILKEDSGKALILCESIIDSQPYYNSTENRDIDGTVYPNNYEYSNIRAWLNETFYETAFTALQQGLIETVTLDNSAKSTNPNGQPTFRNSGNNNYACGDTEDKIFLLSEEEVTNVEYGFNAEAYAYGANALTRQKQATAYALAQGAYRAKSGNYTETTWWWLRSPYPTNRKMVIIVREDGNANSSDEVDDTGAGVVPALWINLDIETSEDPEIASEGLEFVSNGDGTCYVSGIGTCTDLDIIIPDISPDSDIVTGIGIYAFYYCSSLTSIEIPASVTSIGEGAFSGCSSLTSITFAENSQLTSIGEGAFSGCSSLTSITFAENSQLTSIGNGVFSCCSSLTSIELPASVTSIGSAAFSGCSSLTSIEIPAGVTSIDYAFDSCRSLTSITFAENSQLTSIGEFAFYDCSSLTSIEIPASVTSIGKYAFYDCSSLTSIEIPASVTSIGDWAFRECSSLTSVTFAENSQLTSIGSYAFYDCSYLTSIEIPASVTSIGEDAFYGCSSLTIITFAENSQLTSIEKAAFSNCTSLTSIEIPASVTSIGNYAFRGCGLTSIEIPASVTSIGESAFVGCEFLTDVYYGGSLADWQKITIESNNNPLLNAVLHTVEGYEYSEGLKFTSSGYGTCYVSGIGTCTDTDIIIPSVSPAGDIVTSIGERAFDGCSALTSIEIPEGVTSIGNYAFEGCSALTSIEIPEGVTSIGAGAFYGCNALTSIEIPASVTSIGACAFYGCSALTSIEIPEGVTSIGSSAFEDCSALTSIEIPEGVTSIGAYAFAWCSSLTSIEIPEGVTSIGNYVFYECSSLTSIEVPEGVTSIGDHAFGRCSSLTSIEIPASVTSIGEWAFGWCGSLTSITFAENSQLTSTGNYAFYYCNSLTDVYYGGSLSDWQKITIESNNNPLLNAVLHTVEQSNDPRIAVEDKSANAGATNVKVVVSIENNPGFQTLAMNIEYDENVMTLTKAANGSDFSDYTFTKPKNMASGCRAAWYATDMPEEIVDGDLLILTFTIKADAASGTYNVTVSDTKDGSNEFEFAAATGNITVN